MIPSASSSWSAASASTAPTPTRTRTWWSRAALRGSPNSVRAAIDGDGDALVVGEVALPGTAPCRRPGSDADPTSPDSSTSSPICAPVSSAVTGPERHLVRGAGHPAFRDRRVELPSDRLVDEEQDVAGPGHGAERRCAARRAPPPDHPRSRRAITVVEGLARTSPLSITRSGRSPVSDGSSCSRPMDELTTTAATPTAVAPATDRDRASARPAPAVGRAPRARGGSRGTAPTAGPPGCAPPASTTAPVAGSRPRRPPPGSRLPRRTHHRRSPRRGASSTRTASGRGSIERARSDHGPRRGAQAGHQADGETDRDRRRVDEDEGPQLVGSCPPERHQRRAIRRRRPARPGQRERQGQRPGHRRRRRRRAGARWRSFEAVVGRSVVDEGRVDALEDPGGSTRSPLPIVARGPRGRGGRGS